MYKLCRQSGQKYLNHMQLSTLFVKELKHLCHSVVSYFDKGGLNLIFNAHAFVLKKGSVYNCVLRGIHTLHNFLFAKCDDIGYYLNMFFDPVWLIYSKNAKCPDLSLIYVQFGIDV